MNTLVFVLNILFTVLFVVGVLCIIFSKNDEEFIKFASIAIIISIVYCIGIWVGGQNCKNEAVVNSAAHYKVVIVNGKAKIKFHWGSDKND